MNEEGPDSMRVFILPTIYTTVFILTDDQDLKLGSLAFQPKVRTLLTEQGLTFNNAFVNTPVCCPSRFVGRIAGHFLYTFATYVAFPSLACPFPLSRVRSSILTGKYVHNHGTYENNVESGCSAPSWRALNEYKTMGAYMSKAGYKTGLFGMLLCYRTYKNAITLSAFEDFKIFF